MNTELLPFGPGAVALIFGYLMILVWLGWRGYRAREGDSLRDFYLAGNGIGFIVLLFTLYATQYSGNTLFGFSGRTYRVGLTFTVCLHFMTAIIVFYLLIAPHLYHRARKKGYITPTDFLQDRFRSRGLNLVASVVMIVAIANYLLAQLMAMGRAVEGLTAVDPAIGYFWGVILLTLIMVVYETLGGFRAVAWTDVLQGCTLLIGFGIVLVLMFNQFGSIGDAVDLLLAGDTEARAKVMPPTPGQSREWLSYILIVGIGGALYPQAVQRIYAARSARSLRRSLTVMAFLPLTTTVIAICAGILGAAYMPGLEGPEADKILMVLSREVQQASAFGYWLVAVLFAGVLAAMMSTADSVLLSISSMFTKDLYGGFIRPEATEQELTRVGKYVSWILIVVLAVLAIVLRDKATLITLIDRKFDILVQLGPAFFLGLRWKQLSARPVFFGLVAGLVIALTLIVFGYNRVWGFHPGMVGLVGNVVVMLLVMWVERRKTAM